MQTWRIPRVTTLLSARMLQCCGCGFLFVCLFFYRKKSIFEEKPPACFIAAEPWPSTAPGFITWVHFVFIIIKFLPAVCDKSSDDT